MGLLYPVVQKQKISERNTSNLFAFVPRVQGGNLP